MNKQNAIFLTPHFQHDSGYKGMKIMELYAPWGAYLQQLPTIKGKK